MANNILIKRNKGIQKKQEILLLEFCKNTQKQKRGQRDQTMSTMLTQQSTCFCCLDDLSYELNTLGPLCLWQCFFSLSCISCISIVLGYLCSRYFIKSLFRIADSTRTSKRGGNDPKICEILVDNVERKDLGAWRSNLF